MDWNKIIAMNNLKPFSLIFGVSVGFFALLLTSGYFIYRYISPLLPEIKNAYTQIIDEIEKEIDQANINISESTSSYSQTFNYEPNVNPGNSNSKTSPTIVAEESRNPTQTNCYVVTIEEGEFASSKCYLPNDSVELNYNLNKYYSAKSEAEWLKKAMEITCDGSEFFEESCAKYETRKDSVDIDIEKYKIVIRSIINKGKTP